MNRIIDLSITDGSEQVTLPDFKTFARITTEDEDTLIPAFITTARKKVERHTNISLVPKTVILTCYLDKEIILPFPKLDTITTVKYLTGQDNAGANQWETLAATTYQILGTDISTFCPNAAGTYEIEYDTTAFSDVDLLFDIKRVALWLLENRGDTSEHLPVELMSNAKTYKILSWV
jgi:hypothetical protein